MNIRTPAVLAVVVATALSGGCALNQEQTGALAGGAVGAAAGSAIGGGSGRTVAIILGALAGTAIGANIGRHMDEQDRIKTAQVFENNKTGQSSTWTNPDTQDQYTVTPTKTYDSSQGPCREYTMDAQIGGQPQQVYGTACRQNDGSWKIVK